MTRRKYNGKYPNRINSVWASKTTPVHAQTNAGAIYIIKPVTMIGRMHMPRPGVCIVAYQMSPHFIVIQKG